MEEPGFWENSESSTKILRELKNLKAGIEEYKNLENLYEEIEVLIELRKRTGQYLER